jgi:hypothetical protein
MFTSCCFLMRCRSQYQRGSSTVPNAEIGLPPAGTISCTASQRPPKLWVTVFRKSSFRSSRTRCAYDAHADQLAGDITGHQLKSASDDRTHPQRYREDTASDLRRSASYHSPRPTDYDRRPHKRPDRPAHPLASRIALSQIGLRNTKWSIEIRARICRTLTARAKMPRWEDEPLRWI